MPGEPPSTTRSTHPRQAPRNGDPRRHLEVFVDHDVVAIHLEAVLVRYHDVLHCLERVHHQEVHVLFQPPRSHSAPATATQEASRQLRQQQDKRASVAAPTNEACGSSEKSGRLRLGGVAGKHQLHRAIPRATTERATSADKCREACLMEAPPWAGDC